MTVLSSVTKVFCSMAFCSTSTNNKRSHCFGIVCKDASLRIKMIQRCHVSLNCSCYKNLLRIVITCGGKEKKKKNRGGKKSSVLIVSHSSNKDILNQSVCTRIDCTFTPLNLLQKRRNTRVYIVRVDHSILTYTQITQTIFQSLNISRMKFYYKYQKIEILDDRYERNLSSRNLLKIHLLRIINHIVYLKYQVKQQ